MRAALCLAKRKSENVNPEGLTYYEFMDKHKEIPHIAELCWFIGVEPEELKEELRKLLGME